ncbi:protein-disulfide reductase DsbD domain-containing protein [Tundrisphaera sp. TA3]|uniref:protein-disulfide reductase DsbD family protein n=1 Tax=Tundrisphaera sp. TA3 TaxID=3435775 RepID=UPI003EBEBE29
MISLSLHRPRSATSCVRLASAVLLALMTFSPPAAPAADLQPAKKDSNKRAQPKDATLTASVTPAEARPGETVTYKVTARMEPTWHIYAYNKTQPDDGPRLTQFDFFDPAGLKVVGEWTPSRPPIQKNEPAFPDIPFLEFYEEEVTWSIKLTVPADAAPGKKTLRCQAAYQLCSDQSCSFPGQWTLPDVSLTIKPKAAGAAPPPEVMNDIPADASLVRVSAEAPSASPAKPAKKDSNPRAKPKDVAFTTAIEPATARPGDTVQLRVTARINPPWHLYKYAKVQPDGPGPKLTTFDLFDPAGLTPQGEWAASRAPIQKKDPAFEELEYVEFYEDEVTWSLPLLIPADATPGSKTVQVQAGYMICAKVCSIPGQWTLPAATLTVESGGTVPAAAPVAAITPPAPIVPASETRSTDDTAEQASLTGHLELSSMKSDRGGFLGFLVLCAGGGLLALAMPCVWPMIPVTVNFFVKQGQKKGGGNATGLAITYCLAIIGIFTAIGALFSVFLGAGSLSKLANNPWLNFGVAGLFIVFGLSLLGLFEIRLPNALLNASVQGESRGGLVGVMFMALTLTITSFTCTFPVVGALLVAMANGEYFRPIIGMITFASVVAFPFFLLALSPGLLAKMPRSGDWMNSVKVVGGLIELGAAFKFLNTAECAFVVPKEAWTNAYAVLTIWVVLAMICGIYLLGLFKTDHDHGDAGVGPGRIVFGCAFLSLALFLAPALFGRPPQSPLWYTVVGLLPADAGDLKAESHGGGGGERRTAEASSSDPKKAEREQVAFHGVAWGMSYDAAIETAKATGKPVLIDFTGVNCANCRLMEQQVLPREDVAKVLGEFVTIQLYTDFVPINSITKEQRTELAEQNLDREIKLTDEATNPNYVVVDAEGRFIGKMGGWNSPGDFIAFLNDALTRARQTASLGRPGVGG